jgi:hypothetical protein
MQKAIDQTLSIIGVLVLLVAIWLALDKIESAAKQREVDTENQIKSIEEIVIQRMKVDEVWTEAVIPVLDQLQRSSQKPPKR